MNTTIVKLASTDSDTERLLKGSVLLQAEMNAHKRTALKYDTVVKMLEFALDRWEGEWGNDEWCEPEDGDWYIKTARWMQVHHGREDGGTISRVQDFLNKYLPWDEQKAI